MALFLKKGIDVKKLFVVGTVCLLVAGGGGSPSLFAVKAAHAAVSNFDKYLATVKAQIYRDYVRVTSYTVTYKGASKAQVSFTQTASYTRNGRKYTVTTHWEAVVSSDSYYTRQISTSTK